MVRNDAGPVARFLVLLLLLFAGCGVINFQRQVFTSQPLDADGDPLFVDDVRAILQDPSLSFDEMADALRALGLESESLIEALIADGL